MEKKVYRANTRGHSEMSWLKSFHTFSFSTYYDPERMGFGLLRVVNDDQINPSTGFGTHPHANMEIISIPLAGALRHRDSMGNEHVIKKGEVQVMSAGTGITHSEYNNSDQELAHFLQIWVFPEKQNIEPDYSQISYDLESHRNSFVEVVSPTGDNGATRINQQAYFSMGLWDDDQQANYKLRNPSHGLFVMVLKGSVEVAGETLNERDSISLSGIEQVDLKTLVEAELLLIEVPLQ